MRYRYTGPAEVTATLAGGPEALRRFAERASFSKDGRVWLADTPLTDAVLVIPQAVIDDPARWDGGDFVADQRVLEVVVDANDALDCGEILAEDVFAEFPGQQDLGEAHFPVGDVRESSQAPGKLGRVLLRQIDGKLLATANDGGRPVERVTVRIDPAERQRALNWKQE
jgi:hypothetical protein